MVTVIVIVIVIVKRLKIENNRGMLLAIEGSLIPDVALET